MKGSGYIFLVLLIAGNAGAADNVDPNDPNKLSATRWNIVVRDPDNPNELLRAKWDSVVNVLKAEELDTNEKVTVIDKIIGPAFDFPLMGKLTLGRTNWPRLNTAQREKFLTLFVERLKAAYRDKIMLYKDETVLFQPAVRNKDMVHIPMEVISDGKKMAMLYKLHKTDQGWKIYDVEIQGVSILLTYRSQFDDTLKRGTVEDLLAQLEKPAGS